MITADELRQREREAERIARQITKTLVVQIRGIRGTQYDVEARRMALAILENTVTTELRGLADE